MYLLKKLVSLGRSSEKQDEDGSPHVPDDLSEDVSSKEENSTSQDVSDLSEAPAPESSVNFDDFWAEVDNVDATKPKKFGSDDEEEWPADVESEEVPKQAKGLKKKGKKKRGARKDEASEETSSSSQKDESINKDHVSPILVVDENVGKISRKFDSEDEDWLAATEETGSPSAVGGENSHNNSEYAKSDEVSLKGGRNFDSGDENWPFDSEPADLKSNEARIEEIGRKLSSGDENSKSEDKNSENAKKDEASSKIERKFDSGDENWPFDSETTDLKSNDESCGAGIEEIGDENSKLADNNSVTSEVSSKIERKFDSSGEIVETTDLNINATPVTKMSRKFDSDEENWPFDSEPAGLKVDNKPMTKFDSDDEKWPFDLEKNETVVNKMSRKFDSDDENWPFDSEPAETESSLEMKEKSTSGVALTGNPRKFDSEDEQWLNEPEVSNEDAYRNKSSPTCVDREKSISSESFQSEVVTTSRNSEEENFSGDAQNTENSGKFNKDETDKVSELEKDGLLKPLESEEEEWSPSTTQSSNNTHDSNETSTEIGKSGTSIESSHTESSEKKPSDVSDDDVKQAHQRNFAKALQDIGTQQQQQQQQRRRSVLLSDQRERIIQRVSESSTDGETTHDDGIIDFLGKENDRAEARLAARRQARVEAREIRMRELERVQKEQEETSDKVFDLHTPARQPSMSPRERPTSTNSYHSSRRSSEDSMEDGLGLRDLRHELKEVEEKFRKAMIANAQLDNEKSAHAYQVELLKDKLEDLEEAHSLLGREHRERCREHEALKRATLKLKEDLTVCKMQLEERDRLIADYGLIIVGGEINEKGEVTPRELVSNQAAEVLDSAGEGSLDVRLKNLAKDKNDLVDEVRHLKLELEEERTKRQHEQSLTNGPLSDDVVQTLNDYRFRLQKAEQETSTLQATVARLESQVIRYKSAAEESEKAEDELKSEKRKLLREHRESIARIEELETSNSHLQRRMDKLKNAKSTLLKEL